MGCAGNRPNHAWRHLFTTLSRGRLIKEARDYMLGSRRKQAIFLGLPDALDLMVVCVEAGLALDHAMRKVTEEMKKSMPVIAEEFGLCNLHMQMGRSRQQVLQDLGQRSGARFRQRQFAPRPGRLQIIKR